MINKWQAGQWEAKITPASQEKRKAPLHLPPVLPSLTLSKLTKSTPASIRAVLGLGFGAQRPIKPRTMAP